MEETVSTPLTDEQAAALITIERDRALKRMRNCDLVVRLVCFLGVALTAHIIGESPTILESYLPPHTPWSTDMRCAYILINLGFDVATWFFITKVVVHHELDKILEQFYRACDAITARVH